jgi:hypothetical protein
MTRVLPWFAARGHGRHHAVRLAQDQLAVARAWPGLFARRSAPSSPILVGGTSAGALAGLE